jgi:hypothetical protein
MEIAVVIVIVLIAVGAVVLPLLRRDRSTPDAPVREPEVLDEAALDAEIDRYRQAVRDGTICDRCGQANPAGSPAPGSAPGRCSGLPSSATSQPPRSCCPRST